MLAALSKTGFCKHSTDVGFAPKAAELLKTAGGVSVKRFAVEVGVVVFLRIVFVSAVVFVGSVGKPSLSQILHRRCPASVSIAMVMANLRCHRWRCGQQCNGGRSNQSKVCHDTILSFFMRRTMPAIVARRSPASSAGMLMSRVEDV